MKVKKLKPTKPEKKYMDSSFNETIIYSTPEKNPSLEYLLEQWLLYKKGKNIKFDRF